MYRTQLEDPEQGTKTRVLLAEDDEEMRDIVSRAFEVMGYEVIEATDGSEMLAYLDNIYRKPSRIVPVDLIVTDVRMPGADGLEVLRRARLHDTRIPVILMTGFPDEQLRQDANDLYAEAVFEKPFLARKLVERCAAIVPAQI